MYTHQNPNMAWLLLFLHVWGPVACPYLSPSPQIHTHVHTHTSEPKGFSYYCMPGTLSHALIYPSCPAPKDQTYKDTHTCARTHRHTHSYIQELTTAWLLLSWCVLATWRSIPLLPPPVRTAWQNCCGPGNQLVWPHSSVWRRR